MSNPMLNQSVLRGYKRLPDHMYIGKDCKYNHGYDGKTVRYSKGGTCIVCARNTQINKRCKVKRKLDAMQEFERRQENIEEDLW